MARYKLCVQGKLDHLIKTCQDRMCSIPTATRQQINEFYELNVATKEMITNLGISAIESVQANQLDFKMKLIQRDGVGYLCGIAFNCWEDPDKQNFVQEWRELQVVLIKTTDPSAKVPARFTGIINLSLNTSYLQKGLFMEKLGLTWFSYITSLPVWATERKDVLSAGARWVDIESFGKIKESAMLKKQEIRLADKKGPDAEKESKWPIFNQEAAETVHFSLYDKEEGKFNTKTLAEVTDKVGTKKERKPSEQRIDRTSKPSNLGNVTRQSVPSRIDEYVNNDNREMENSGIKPSVHHVPMESFEQFETAVDDPRESFEQFKTNIDQVVDNMNRVKLGVHHVDGNIVPAECVGEIRNNERIRQLDNSYNNRNPQQGGRNTGERIVPQPSGQIEESRHREPLLDTHIPHNIGASDPLLLPRAPLGRPTPWSFQSSPGEDVHLEKERSRLHNFRMTVGERNVTFGQAAQGPRGAGFDEVRSDQQSEHPYEEIPDLSDPDQSTPRSRLGVQLPQVSVRSTRPHRVVLNYPSEMHLPGAFQFPPPNPSQFNFLPATAPLYVRRNKESVQIEESPVVNVSSSDKESSWEDEEENETEEAVDWSGRRFLGPRFPSLAKENETSSYEKDKQELKSLIDRELTQVNRLEQQINKSKFLEGIYVDKQCTLLDQPEIACATTNPDLLSANPKERLEIMQKLYETIAKAKRDRLTVLKRLEDAERPRRSKRLLKKPRRRYDKF